MLTEYRRFARIKLGPCVSYHELVLENGLVLRDDQPFTIVNPRQFFTTKIEVLVWVWGTSGPTSQFEDYLEEVTLAEVVAARLRGECVYTNPNAMEI